jgi:hypothetical protein
VTPCPTSTLPLPGTSRCLAVPVGHPGDATGVGGYETPAQVRERLLFEDVDRAGWFSAAGISALEAPGPPGTPGTPRTLPVV